MGDCMKNLWMLALVLFCVFSASGAVIINSGLDLCGGVEEVELVSGERLFLSARHSIFKYPILKGLSYSSQHPSVAYVDRYGWIHALFPGKTVISVWNETGDNGTITVIVKNGRKLPSIGWGVSVGLSILIFGFVIAKKVRCFS